MGYYDGFGLMLHSYRLTVETRTDKYGQNIKLKCKCGIVTNWHCEKWQAEDCMRQLHTDMFKQWKQSQKEDYKGWQIFQAPLSFFNGIISFEARRFGVILSANSPDELRTRIDSLIRGRIKA